MKQTMRMISTRRSAIGQVLLTIAAAFAIGTQAYAGDPKAEVEALEQKWSAALAANDAAALAPLLADDWTNVTTEGKLETKAQLLDAIKSGKLKMTSCKLGKLTTRVYGDTVVVIGSDSSKGTENGEEFESEEVFTDVWVKKGDTWVCVSTQAAEKDEE